MKGRRRFLTDFPPDYKLFTQTKDGRTDHYLVGTAPAHFYCIGFRVSDMVFLRQGRNIFPPSDHLWSSLFTRAGL